MPPIRHGNVLSWASDIEPATLAQAERTASLPFLAGPVALMPDAHIGMGATIGSVIATRGALVPSAVGVDLGCGMIAVQTSIAASQLPDSLDRLESRIADVVPAGMGRGHEARDVDVLDLIGRPPITELTDRQEAKARSQYGSLGSGNHFVEVCLDEGDVVWVVLHSGSRGIGNELATRHIEEAKGIMKRAAVELPDPDLAHLTEGTPEFAAYVGDMLWSQEYAMANREAMMDAVLTELFTTVPGTELDRVNCHHNFTQREHHGGADVWVTRKGAIQARDGMRGVIPGSMGTRSYIVSGLGNDASYQSCSHGAGRRLSRTAARKTLDVEGFKASMAGKAWQHQHATDLLDEDPRAYKDIDQVMADQRDLVRIEHTLHQILNYKGVEERRGRGKRHRR